MEMCVIERLLSYSQELAAIIKLLALNICRNGPQL